MSAAHDPVRTAADGADGAEPADTTGARWRSQVRLAVLVGVLAALGGLVDGVVLAAHRVATRCPDGTFFPQGATDLTCHRHPDAGLGLAVAALSIALGCLLVVAGLVAQALDRTRSSGWPG